MGKRNQGDKEKKGKDESKERASKRDEERRKERKKNVYQYRTSANFLFDFIILLVIG